MKSVGFTSTYEADFGFSVFVNRLKTQRVSEGSNERKCCKDGLETKKGQLSVTWWLLLVFLMKEILVFQFS